MSSEQEILKKIHEARRELLDLGLRNSLLSYRPTKRRGIEVIDECSADLYDLLVRQGKTMSFLGKAVARDENAEQQDEMNDDDDPKYSGLKPGADPHRDSWLQTSLSFKTLETKLLATHTFALSHIEERGVNILFLALGMMYWDQAGSGGQQVKAPILLVPVELERTSALEKFKIRYNEEEIEENISLSTKLANDFRITFPEFPGTEDLVLGPYFQSIRDSIRTQRTWRVEDNEIHLGFFSFGKYLMYKDLDPDRWPAERRLENNTLLKSILMDGFGDTVPPATTEDSLDDKVTPDALPQVLDADSTQLQAILEVQDGRDLVIQGPPGTGKSQTIANIIANGIARGKRILFVSEKMAALEVVKRRLDNLGLGDACIEIHSYKANKKDVIAELKRTWALGQPKVDSWDSKLEQFQNMRRMISEYITCLTRQYESTGFTPYQLIGEIARERRILAGVEVPTGIKFDWPIEDYSSVTGKASPDSLQNCFSRHNMESAELLVMKLQRHLKTMGLPNAHPFIDSNLTALYEHDKIQLAATLRTAMTSVAKLRLSMLDISSFMGLEFHETTSEARLVLRAARRALNSPHLTHFDVLSGEWQSRHDDILILINDGINNRKIHDKLDAHLIPEAWTTDVLGSRKTLQVLGSKWWRFFSSEYRKASACIKGLCSNEPPKDVRTLIEVADSIMESQKLTRSIENQDELGRRIFGIHWQAQSSDWLLLQKINGWVFDLYREVGCGELPKSLINFLAGSPSFQILETKVSELEISLSTYSEAMQCIQRALQMSEERFVNVVEVASLNSQESYLSKMLEGVGQLQDIVTFNILLQELAKLKLSWVSEISVNWEPASTHLVSVFRKEWFEVLLRKAFEERQPLRSFDTSSHEINIDRFKELDLELLKHCRLLIVEKHFSDIPFSTGIGQVGILRREFEKKRRLLPIRQLMTRCGSAIQAMKPVFMMSPISVASFLSQDSVIFDLVSCPRDILT